MKHPYLTLKQQMQIIKLMEGRERIPIIDVEGKDWQPSFEGCKIVVNPDENETDQESRRYYDVSPCVPSVQFAPITGGIGKEQFDDAFFNMCARSVANIAIDLERNMYMSTPLTDEEQKMADEKHKEWLSTIRHYEVVVVDCDELDYDATCGWNKKTVFATNNKRRAERKWRELVSPTVMVKIVENPEWGQGNDL